MCACRGGGGGVLSPLTSHSLDPPLSYIYCLSLTYIVFTYSLQSNIWKEKMFEVKNGEGKNSESKKI